MNFYEYARDLMSFAFWLSFAFLSISIGLKIFLRDSGE